MLQAKSLGLIIFTLLNAFGVCFLLYVLAHFWKEGHQSANGLHPRARVSAYGARSKVLLMTGAVTAEMRPETLRVIELPIRDGAEQPQGDRDDLPGRTRKTLRSVAR